MSLEIQNVVKIEDDKIRVKANTGLFVTEFVSILFEDISSIGISTNKTRLKIFFLAAILIVIAILGEGTWLEMMLYGSIALSIYGFSQPKSALQIETIGGSKYTVLLKGNLQLVVDQIESAKRNIMKPS
jgi:hypothetical protein